MDNLPELIYAAVIAALLVASWPVVLTIEDWVDDYRAADAFQVRASDDTILSTLNKADALGAKDYAARQLHAIEAEYGRRNVRMGHCCWILTQIERGLTQSDEKPPNYSPGPKGRRGPP